MNKACCTLSLFLITVSLFAQSSNDSAMRDAGRLLNDLLAGVNTSTGVIQNTSPQISRERGKPAWVDNPYAVYDRVQYIAQVGHASNRNDAEKNALSNLASYFGLSLKSEFVTDTVYSETISKGKLVVFESTRVRDTIITAATMDKLIGAEIVSIWEDTRAKNQEVKFYALGIINKQRTVAIYSEIVRINLINIETLIKINEEEKNTLNGIARYKLAVQIAKRNEKYAEVILAAGGSTAGLNLNGAGFSGLNLDDEVKKIIQNTTVAIDISVNVDGETYNDNGNRNRIRDAAAKLIEKEQMQTVWGSVSLYTLKLTINMDTSTNNGIFYSDYYVSSNLIENSTGKYSSPFKGISKTEWRSTKKDTINACFDMIVRAINEQYSVEFNEFFRKLIPEI